MEAPELDRWQETEARPYRCVNCGRSSRHRYEDGWCDECSGLAVEPDPEARRRAIRDLRVRAAEKLEREGWPDRAAIHRGA